MLVHFGGLHVHDLLSNVVPDGQFLVQTQVQLLGFRVYPDGQVLVHLFGTQAQALEFQV